MSKWTSEAEARNQIKDLVKDYYEAFKKPEQEKAKARLHPCGLSRFSVCAC